MVQPLDYIHKSGLAGLTLNNFVSRNTSGFGNPASIINTLFAQPFFTGDEPLSILGLGVLVSGSGSAATMGIAIYESTSTRNLYPSNRLHDLGTVSYTGGGVKLASLVTTLPAGKLFWIATNTSGGTGSHAALTAPNMPVGPLGLVAPAGSSATSAALGLSVAHPFTSGMPAIFPSGAVPNDGDDGFPAIIIEPS